MARSNWVVEVSDVGIGDAEPTQYGPYSKKRAQQIVEALNRRMAEGWYAGCFPLWNPDIPTLVAQHSEPQVAGDGGSEDRGYSTRSDGS